MALDPLARIRTLMPGDFINLGETELTADATSDPVRLQADGAQAPTFILARSTGDNDAGAGNEVQSLTIGGAGLTSFTITYSGQTTASIPVAAVAATVQAELEALSNLAPGDVIVTGGPLETGPFFIEFAGTLADTNVAAVTTTPTGGTGVVTVATVTGGGTGTFDMTLEGSFDADSWYTLATWTQATTTAFAENEVVGPAALPPYIRANFNVGGSNPSYTFDLWVAVA